MTAPAAARPEDARRVLLARPRGYCAGVERAVVTVEKALEAYGAPVYVRKQIVHNAHVVRRLQERGAVFVEETAEVPEGAIVVFSAHGVAPVVHAEAAARGLRTIDATCPLVTKVHLEARRFAADDYDIVLIGHDGHEEVVGTTGEAPAHIHLVDGARDAAGVAVRDPHKVAYLSQTTLSVDETEQTVAVALAAGARAAHLVDDADHLVAEWLDGVRTVGVTSGASVPDHLVFEVLAWLAELGYGDVTEVESARERLQFALPPELRRDLRSVAVGSPERGSRLPARAMPVLDGGY